MDSDLPMGLFSHRLRKLFVLAVGVLVGAAAIRTLIPQPFVRYVTPKESHLRENPDAYDVLIVGSSRIVRQVSPRVFDHQLAAHGLNLRTFNTGIPAAKSVEVRYFLKNLAVDQRFAPATS